MADLLALPWYRERIGGHQEVMIGYSDSAKDAGRLTPTGRCTARRKRSSPPASGRRPADALSRPRRQHRTRRRADVSRDSVAAARLDSRDAARHRAGRDDPGEVRPRRHRDADARGVHDRHARSDGRAAAGAGPSGARAWIRSPLAPGRRIAVVYEEPRFIPYFRTATPEPELTRSTSAAVRRAARRVAASRACARSRGSSPGRRPDCCCLRGSASRMR